MNAQTTKPANMHIVGMMESLNTNPAHHAFPQYKIEFIDELLHISYADMENNTNRFELDREAVTDMLNTPWSIVPEEVKPILQEIVLHPKLIWAKNIWVDNVKAMRLNEILLTSMEEYNAFNKLPEPSLSEDGAKVTLASLMMTTEVSIYHNGEVWYISAVQHVVGGDDVRFIRLTDELFGLLVEELDGFRHVHEDILNPVVDELRQMN